MFSSIPKPGEAKNGANNTPASLSSKRNSSSHNFSSRQETQFYGLNTNELIQRSPCPCGGGCPQCMAPPVQAKLKVATPDDKYEKEADQIAQQIVSAPNIPHAPQIQHQCTDCAENDKKEKKKKKDAEIIQTKPLNRASSVNAPVNPLNLPGGRPMNSGERSFFEPRFGADFSSVRIHEGEQAGQMARSLNAKAFTLGNDIVMGRGQYSSGSSEGQKLMAHELAHVRQQNAGTVHRECDCASMGAVVPTDAEKQELGRAFPPLLTEDFCISGPIDGSYNCHGFAASIMEFITGPQVDRRWGNADGRATASDFDSFYGSLAGYIPAPDFCPPDAKVALYEKNGEVKHSARVRDDLSCGLDAESKLGQNRRILHRQNQLEGASYGHISRYYY